MLKEFGHSKPTEYLWDLKTQFSFANLSFRCVLIREFSQHVTCDSLYNFLIVALPIPLCISITLRLLWNKTNVICKACLLTAILQTVFIVCITHARKMCISPCEKPFVCPAFISPQYATCGPPPGLCQRTVMMHSLLCSHCCWQTATAMMKTTKNPPTIT